MVNLKREMGRCERGCYILSETHFGHTECGAGNRHMEEELLKDLWVKYGRCSTSIHLRWEQNHSLSYSFLRGEKKLFRICSDDAIHFIGRAYHGLIKAKFFFFVVFYTEKLF